VHKRIDTASHSPDHLTKRILLSRETIRMLTSEELSHVAGGCPSPSQETAAPDDLVSVATLG
jgi:hypothetical protein